jgi:hypothetical protein
MWLQKLLQIGAFFIDHLNSWNPKRIFTTNENQILAPVDGKVVVIVYEGEYYKDKRAQISCHLNVQTRYAISLWNSANTILGNFWSHGIRKLVKKTNELPSSLKTIRLGLSYTVKLPVH